MGIRAQHADRAWIAYEDAIYRTHDGLVDAALQRLRHGDDWLAASAAHSMGRRKRAAVLAYASQLRGLGADALSKIALPETYWMPRTQQTIQPPPRASARSLAT